MPKLIATEDHRNEVKTELWSEVMVSGSLNFATQLFRKALIQDSVDKFCIGTASGHLVVLSTMVKLYLLLFDGGSRLIMWMWM